VILSLTLYSSENSPLAYIRIQNLLRIIAGTFCLGISLLHRLRRFLLDFSLQFGPGCSVDAEVGIISLQSVLVVFLQRRFLRFSSQSCSLGSFWNAGRARLTQIISVCLLSTFNISYSYCWSSRRFNHHFTISNLLTGIPICRCYPLPYHNYIKLLSCDMDQDCEQESVPARDLE
jgi:hypothetical protein